MGWARFSYSAKDLARRHGTTVEQIETWVKEGQLKGEYVKGVEQTYVSGDQLPILAALIKGEPDPQNAVARAFEAKGHAEFLHEGEEASKAKRYPPKPGGELDKFLHKNRLPGAVRTQRERSMIQKDGKE